MRMTFQVSLEKFQAEWPGVAAWLPFDPTQAWPERKKLRVKGSIRAAASASPEHTFSTNLIHSKTRGYFLLVTGKMQKAARVAPGQFVEVSLEPELDDRAATPPPELAKLFKADRSVKKWYDTFSFSTRKYIAGMISEPKSAEVRIRRAEQWMERLMLTMEGEEFPPPILQVAFRRQPRARKGWQAMTVNQRRAALLHLFGCQSPEAQAKSVERALAEAMRAAERLERDSARVSDPGLDRVSDQVLDRVSDQVLDRGLDGVSARPARAALRRPRDAREFPPTEASE